MARKLRSDRTLFAAMFLLVCTSIVMVYSASVVVAGDRFGQPYLFLFKQVTWTVLGLFLMALVMRIDYRHYRQPAIVLGLLAAVAVALLVVLLSPPINGTRRWFGVAGIGVQPSEFAKIAAILFTAWWLETRMDQVNDWRAVLLPVGGLMVFLCLAILAEPDFGTAASVAAVMSAILFSAGMSYRYLALAGLVALPLAGLAVALEPYRMQRLVTFMDPWKDPQGAGFQVIQSLIAVGAGGVTGTGLSQGTQKLHFLPEPFTDFIYAVIAEELGLLGATAVVVCFAVIAWRGYLAAEHAPDRFGAFVAVGITTMIVLQGFVNISVVLGLLPTKGIPLPFVSAGGSSLLVNLLAMGILLNVSQQASSRT
jgi:cell division protein FtsW